MPGTWISVVTGATMVLIEKIVVVPDTSLPTASIGSPVGDFSAEMNVTPSGPRSPAADRSVMASLWVELKYAGFAAAGMRSKSSPEPKACVPFVFQMENEREPKE